LTWKLQHIHLILALILLSHTTGHVGDFDIDIFKYPILCFKITPTMTFRRRDIGSIKHVTGGPGWILADNEAPYTKGFGDDFEGVPYAKSIDNEQVDKFNTGKPSELIFGISTYTTRLSILGGCVVSFVGSDGEPVSKEAGRCKAIYCGHGVVLPSSQRLLERYTGETGFEGEMVEKDEVLCGWFELKPGYSGDTIFERLVDPASLVENAEALVKFSSFDPKVKLLLV
jgi:hypothetical protein